MTISASARVAVSLQRSDDVKPLRTLIAAPPIEMLRVVHLFAADKYLDRPSNTAGRTYALAAGKDRVYRDGDNWGGRTELAKAWWCSTSAPTRR